MVILDAPYASNPLLDWLVSSQHPVLANEFSAQLARGGYGLALVSEEEAIARLEAGERIYTNSENALAWILAKVNNPTLTNAIRLFKDKAAMREKLAALNPHLYYQTVPREALDAVRVEDVPLPVVLKPTVGFCSMGVYVIDTPADWEKALVDIAQRENDWHARYPESVVGGSEYIIEGYIRGTEYALDAYFDEEGTPHLLNILRHDFAGPEDTSDRMYLTSSDIIEEYEPRFTAWLADVNEVVGARNVPVHVELRVNGDAIVPIEFNALRFAGLGGTDVSYYGVGVRTCEAFLENEPVNLRDIYKQHEGSVYSMSLLNPAPEADLSRPFNSEALKAKFSHVIGYNDFDPQTTGFYGFLFLETTEETKNERDYLLHSDLMEFVE
jgi:hypothetical protein